jgi:hypothetical protein
MLGSEFERIKKTVQVCVRERERESEREREREKARRVFV